MKSRMLLLIAALALTGQAQAGDGVRPELLVKLDHKSDLLKGWPVNNQPEWTLNSLTIGATLHFGPKVEADFTHGVRAFGCAGLKCERSEPSTELQLRWYPGR
jgi:hypothetical protein